MSSAATAPRRPDRARRLGQPGSGQPDRRGRPVDRAASTSSAGNGAEGVLIESSGTAGDPSSIVYASSNTIGGAVGGRATSSRPTTATASTSSGVGCDAQPRRGQLHRRGTRRRLPLRQRRAREPRRRRADRRRTRQPGRRPSRRPRQRDLVEPGQRRRHHRRRRPRATPSPTTSSA